MSGNTVSLLTLSVGTLVLGTLLGHSLASVNVEIGRLQAEVLELQQLQDQNDPEPQQP